MVEIMREELKDLLLTEPLNESATSKAKRLPSPKDLYGKILIKVIKDCRHPKISTEKYSSK
jgi:hypothetical protein